MSQFHMHLLKGVTHGVESRVAISNSHDLSLRKSIFCMNHIHDSGRTLLEVASFVFYPLHSNHIVKLHSCFTKTIP